MTSDIVKMDEDRRMAWGWASVSEENGRAVVDKQGDVIDERALEEAAFKYVLGSRRGGVMHEKVGVAKLVESMVFTKAKQEALGIDLGRVGWFVGFRIDDDEVWKRVKRGELRAFSIHGRATRVDG